MSRGRATASKSLLLDYVSGFQPLVISASLKNAHYSVSAAVTGSLAISIMIIASTGLLGLERRTMDISNHPISTTTTFKGVRSDLDNVGTLPLYITRGLQALQLPYPSGTTSRYAVQSFESLQNIDSGSQLTATVDGLLTGIDCEIADIDVQYWYLAEPPQQPALGSIPFVPYSSATLKTSTCQFEIGFPYTQPGANYVTVVDSANCDNEMNKGPDRLYVLFGSMLTVSSNITGLGNQNVSLLQSAQLVCKPYYNFGKVSVTVNNTQESTQTIIEISPLPGSTPAVMSDISAWNIAETYLLAFSNGQSVFDSSFDPWSELAFYFTLLQYPNKQSTDFMDPSLLKDASESLYSLLSTQIVRQLLLGASEDNITGTLRTTEERLIVRTLSLRLLEGLLAFTAALGICIIFLLPGPAVLPRDPGSLLATTLLFSRSQHAMRTLQDAGSLAMDAITSRIFGIEYSTSLDFLKEQPYFQVEARIPPYYKLDAMPANDTVQKWWQPFMAGRWALGSCLLIQVGIIVALEVTLRQSRSHNGLADVTTGGYLPYLWSLLPAFVLSCIALAYTSIGFHTKVFAPYSALKSTTTASNALLVNYLDKTQIHCMWSAARLRQFAVFGITLAVVLGSFLTIAVSGVFLVQSAPVQVPVDISIASWFNTSDISGGVIVNNQFTAKDGTSAMDALVASALVVEGNLSYPAWTYGEFVFPHIQVNGQSVADASNAQLKNATSLQVKVPALRSKMECGWYKADKQLNATFLPSTTCTTHTNGNTTCTTSIDYTNAAWNASGDPYCSSNAPVPVGVGTFGNVQNYAEGCQPTYVWGITGVRTINHIVAMSCNNTMEQLDVNVTFTLPDFLIDASNPPIADESTATFFSYPDILGEGSLFGGLPNFTAPPHIDNYFAALTQGKDGFPVSELADPALDDTIAARIKHLNALLRAQEYNTEGRIPATGAIAARKLTGMATDPYRTRLVQTEVSTRIVQCLLGVMALLAVISHFAMDTRMVLPKNPCSIAGMASLLVDSEFLKDDAILGGAGWEGDRTLRKRGALDRLMCRLGWFDIPNARASVAESGVPSSPGSVAGHAIRRKPLPSVRRRFGVDVVRSETVVEEAVGLTVHDETT